MARVAERAEQVLAEPGLAEPVLAGRVQEAPVLAGPEALAEPAPGVQAARVRPAEPREPRPPGTGSGQGVSTSASSPPSPTGPRRYPRTGRWPSLTWRDRTTAIPPAAAS